MGKTLSAAAISSDLKKELKIKSMIKVKKMIKVILSDFF